MDAFKLGFLVLNDTLAARIPPDAGLHDQYSRLLLSCSSLASRGDQEWLDGLSSAIPCITSAMHGFTEPSLLTSEAGRLGVANAFNETQSLISHALVAWLRKVTHLIDGKASLMKPSALERGGLLKAHESFPI